MKIVIAGSRHYAEYVQAKIFIDDCINQLSYTRTPTILSGDCRGADKIGERYAAEHNYAVERYLPNWALYGRGAGPRRNRDMVDACDVVICFWDGQSRGTKSLLEYARKKGKKVYIKTIKMSRQDAEGSAGEIF